MFGLKFTWPKMGRNTPNSLLDNSRPKNANDLIVKIIQEFKDKSRQDVTKWRNAFEMADHPTIPKWFAIQDLYEYLRGDAHTSSQLELRKSTTLSTRFYVFDKKTGQENPEKTTVLQSQWFFTLMSEILEANICGYLVAQLVDPDTMEFSYIPRRNVVIQHTTVLLKVSDETGINYKDRAFADSIIEVRSKNLFGLMNDLVPQIIWKQNAQQSWAEFSEKFGMPLITATTQSRIKTDIDKIEKGLKQLGEAANAVLPEGTKIEIHDTGNKSDPYKIYDQQIERCNGEISKRITGGTMNSDNGSSKSQAEVHERNLDDKLAENDRRIVEFTVMDQLFPMMKHKGFNPDTDGFAFDRSRAINAKDHWFIVNEALDHYEIDQDWVAKTFQMPIKGKKEQPATPSFNAATKSLAAALVAKGCNAAKLHGFLRSCSLSGC